MRFLCIRYFYLDNIHQNNLFRLDVNNFGFDIGETHDFREIFGVQRGASLHFFFSNILHAITIFYT